MMAGSYNQNSSFQLEALRPALDLLPSLAECTSLKNKKLRQVINSLHINTGKENCLCLVDYGCSQGQNS